MALFLCHSWFSRSSSQRTGHNEFPTLHGRPRAFVPVRSRVVHLSSLWGCLCVNVAPDQCSVSARVATLPLCLGGLGLRSASRTSTLAYWQHEAGSRVERQHREDDILPTLDESACILLRSQSGPAAGAALSATPSNPAIRIDSALCRILFL